MIPAGTAAPTKPITILSNTVNVTIAPPDVVIVPVKAPVNIIGQLRIPVATVEISGPPTVAIKAPAPTTNAAPTNNLFILGQFCPFASVPSASLIFLNGANK